MVDLLRKHFRLISWIALFLVGGISALSLYELRNIKFDYDFESFFPDEDNDLEAYLKYRKTFEYDNEFVLVAIENKRGVFRPDFLDRVRTLSDSLKEMKDMTSVVSPTNLTNTIISDLGPIQTPLLHIDQPEVLSADSVQVYRSEELVGSFFSLDAKSLCLFLKTTEGISKEASDSLLTKMEKAIAIGKFDRVHIAGKMNGQKVYLDKLRNEFIIFFIASFFLVVLFLFISFRSLWGIWVPVVVVLLSILWTLALMTFLGKALDIMTVLLPTMMFVVGMSDVVHIVTKYLEEMRDGTSDRFDALIKTIKEAGFPTFITLITTALGFLTLVNSHIKPIRDFGFYTSLGVFIAFVLSYTILPIVLHTIRIPKLRLESETSGFWNKRLHQLLLWIFSHQKWIAGGTILFILVALFGIFKLQMNNFLIEGLTRNDELRKDFDFFEKQYSGVRPFELLITPRDTTHSVMGVAELRALDKLDKFLHTKYGVGFIISPLSLVKSYHKAQNNADPAFYKLPQDSTDIVDITNNLSRFRKRKEIKTLVTKDGKKGRITGKMHDIGSLKIRKLNAELEAFLKQKDLQPIRVEITGAAHMLDKNNEYLAINTLQGLALSILVVAVIIAIIHRNLRMVVIAVIPNLIPIIFIGGLMGFAGIEIRSSTSIIFSIAFGIATDDTIHFLARLKIEMQKGIPLLYAVKRTFLSTGKAVIVTSLILCAGFFTLICSGFESTYYFGLLVSITLFVAVLTDLLLFPVLVLWLMPKQKKKLKQTTT
jgi:uncharacterized protein